MWLSFSAYYDKKVNFHNTKNRKSFHLQIEDENWRFAIFGVGQFFLCLESDEILDWQPPNKAMESGTSEKSINQLINQQINQSINQLWKPSVKEKLTKP